MVFASVTTSTQTLLLIKAEGLIGDKQFIAILSELYIENKCDTRNETKIIFYH